MLLRLTTTRTGTRNYSLRVASLTLHRLATSKPLPLSSPWRCFWRSFSATTTTVPPLTSAQAQPEHDDALHSAPPAERVASKYHIPQRLRQKVLSPSDAVALVRDGDTVSCSGFVCQGVAEAVLKALGERYEATGHPNMLTLLFGGGPGDWDSRGLNHLAKLGKDESSPPMLRRTIGSHYGQVPKVAELALKNQVAAWTLPMGSVSRMIRAQSTHSPGHITKVGMGTYIDPDQSGGAANDLALESPLHKQLVSKIEIDGQTYLMYKALPINVAIIRGTTADARGNISIEQESLKCDQMITAAAATNSGGFVIAQVKRLAADGSLPARSIAVPGALVDAVVVVDEEDHDTLHPMSFVERHNPSLTGEIRTPREEMEKLPLDIRKIIARKAFFHLKPNQIVNLGIGLPEGVAGVAAEEGVLHYVTLSTEAGAFGGIPASGHSFGPSINAAALVEMNQMFDFYDGGGLDVCFLGAAQISKNGDVNVSRMSKDRLTGPGGFVDISQSTPRVIFMAPFTAKGLNIDIPGDGTLKITSEGQVPKFVNEVLETTFSGDEAVKRGQEVTYVTERAVFRRTAAHDVIELMEIAPGLDLQKDILNRMEFAPVISPELKTMDPRIFKESKMNTLAEMFGSLDSRFKYSPEEHIMYLDLFGITLATEDDINWFYKGVRGILAPLVAEKGKVNMVVNYNGFDIRNGLEHAYGDAALAIQNEMYATVKRYTGNSFHRASLGQELHTSEWDADQLFDLFDLNHNGSISAAELRTGMKNIFQIRLTPNQIPMFGDQKDIDRAHFAKGLTEVMKTQASGATYQQRFGKFSGKGGSLEESKLARRG